MPKNRMTQNLSHGKLIILSAPSGSGKTTIARHLLNLEFKLRFSVSACSRDKREGEKDGVDYYFLSPEEFRAQIEKDEFLEWEEVYPDHYYGTLKSEVKRITQSGNNVLFDVDVIGGMNIKKHYGEAALSIFIQPPSLDELRNRLKLRSTDSDEKIQMRLDKAKHEMSFAENFDLVIVNNELEAALAEAEKAVGMFLSFNHQNLVS